MANEKSKEATNKEQMSVPSTLSLLHTLRGHEDKILSIAWSPDGRLLASCSDDQTIRVWDGQTGKLLLTLKGHTTFVLDIAWSPDGRLLASGSQDKTIRLWDGQTGKTLRLLKGHTDSVWGVAWSPDGQLLASGSSDQTIRLWDGQTGKSLQVLEGHTGTVYRLAWSPDGRVLASCSDDNTVRLWDGQTGKSLQVLEGHTSFVYNVIWSPNGHFLATGSKDKTIRLWDGQTGRALFTLEGHTKTVPGLSFSPDGQFLASKSEDNTVRLWRAPSWEMVEILEEGSGGMPWGLAFHPQTPILATTGERDIIIHIWDVDFPALMRKKPITPAVHYTTAKIALVGDSSVGKSGLGYRIAEDCFQVTESTHGQQFWVVEKLSARRSDGTLCEAVLWDFAGQPNFRPIHALFLDDVDLALLLFDPSRPDTLAGVDYWLKQLVHKERQQRPTILIAARTDVSQMSMPISELEAFCREHGISGRFIATSAKTNEGVEGLLERIREQIDWYAKPMTITTETFKRVKDYVLALKADTSRSKVLVSFEQLRHDLEATDADWHFSDDELVAAVGHLQNHGYVTILRRSSDEQSILLAPDVLINLASSIMLRAQANEKGLGSLEEARVLRNDYHFQEVEALGEDERATLLNAAVELFLNKNVCFRESIDNQTFLIFPSLILERPPRLAESADLVDDITYVVSGQVENVYAALVVLLGYSPSFQRMNQWRKQVQYETIRGEICGFKLTNDDPGELELVLYYGKATPDYVRLRFQGLFEEILHTHNVTARKYAPVVCPKCHRQQERSTVIQLLAEGEPFLFCAKDGTKIRLKQPEPLRMSTKDRVLVDRDQALVTMRTQYETALSSIKKFVQKRKRIAPTCFISYAWGSDIQAHWVATLADDLRKADLNVILDQWDSAAIGTSIPRFIERIEGCDFVLVIGTPAYRKKYENKISPDGSVVAAEMDLVNRRLIGTEAQKASIMPLLLEGVEETSFPPLLHGRNYANFRREEYYFVTLFDLLLTLYSIPFNDPLVRDLREQMRKDADRLSGKEKF